MENTEIGWCHHTGNIWIGCSAVHKGCDNCYAEAQDRRWKGGHWGPDTPRKMVASFWDSIKKFQAKAATAGETHRVFIGSMMDIFEKPFKLEDSKGNQLSGITTGDLRDRFFTEVVPACPNLQFLLLTKRPGNINKYIPKEWLTNPPPNVMYGCSIVDLPSYKDLMSKFLRVEGAKFLSIEPMLGEFPLAAKEWEVEVKVNQLYWKSALQLLNWIIVGGESGHGSRIMNPEWARSIKDQCKEAGVPFFFKQHGEYIERGQMTNEQFELYREAPYHRIEDQEYFRIGKKAAGSLLFGTEYKEFPDTSLMDYKRLKRNSGGGFL